jgi:hypothetical protein
MKIGQSISHKIWYNIASNNHWIGKFEYNLCIYVLTSVRVNLHFQVNSSLSILTS